MTAPYRRAALTLHALAAADRQWLLSRLAQEQRERLQPLLDELAGLEARFDPSDIATLTEPSVDLLPAQAPAPVAESDVLAGIDEHALAATLAGEPDWAIAALMQGAAPAMQSRLLAACSAHRGAAIGALARNGRAPTASAQAALVSALLEQAALHDEASGSTAPPFAAVADRQMPPPATGPLQRMRRWLR